MDSANRKEISESDLQILLSITTSSDESRFGYWFKALKKTAATGKSEISFDEILANMVLEYWKDATAKIVAVNSSDVLSKMVRCAAADKIKPNYSALIEYLQNTKSPTARALKHKLYSTAYDFLIPFADDSSILIDNPDRDELGKRLNSFENIPYHIFSENGARSVVIDSHWANYFKENSKMRAEEDVAINDSSESDGKALLARLKSELSKPDIELISQVEISDEEYEELLDYAREKIKLLRDRTIMSPDAGLSVALVQVAIRGYEGGKYWEIFDDELGIPVPNSKHNLINRTFDATLKQYNLFQRGKSQRGTLYVENIKAHAFVTNSYLEGYFDFLYSFYDRNLERTVDEEKFRDDVSDLVSYMKKSLSSDSDEIELEQENGQSAKTYKLLMATRTVLAQCSVSTVEKLLHEHLNLMDEWYHSENDADFHGSRFNEAFNIWAEKHVNEIMRETVRTKGKHSGVFYRKPFLKIDKNSFKAYIVIPQQKIRDDNYSGGVLATISGTGTEKQVFLDTMAAFGAHKSNEVNIEIEDLFAGYEIKIKSGNERSFRIEPSSYRLMDDDLVQIPRLRNGNNMLFTKQKCSVSGCKPVYENHDDERWTEYSYSGVDDRTVIYIDGEPISTFGGFVEGINYDAVPKEYDLYKNNEKKAVFYKHPVIGIKIGRNNVKKSVIWVGKKKIPLDTVASSIVEIQNEPARVGVTIPLEGCLPDSDGLYKVVLDEPGKNEKLICEYVFVKSLFIHFDQYLYFSNKAAEISCNEDYKLVPINCTEIEENRFQFLFENGDTPVFSLNLPDGEYEIRLKLNVFKYGFGKEMFIALPDYIWLDSIKNELKTVVPEATAARLCYYIEKDKPADEAVRGELKNGVFEFNIYSLVIRLKNSSSKFNYLTLEFLSDGKWRKRTLFRVLSSNWVNYIKFGYDEENGSVFLDVDYLGENDLLIKVEEIVAGGTVPVINMAAVTNGANYFPELKKDALYNIFVYEQEKDEFGLGIGGKPVLTGHPYYFVGYLDINGLSDKTICLKNVYCCDKKMEINNRFSYCFKDLKKVEDQDGTYICTMLSRFLKCEPVEMSQQARLVFAKEENEILLVDISTYDEDAEIFGEMYFDSRLKTLQLCEIMYTEKDISRFSPLYEDLTQYEFYLKGDM